jgi:DNA-nicking Smr family endonuclease
MPKTKSIGANPLHPSLRHSPFDRLKGLKHPNFLASKPLPQNSQKHDGAASESLDEKKLFLEAMSGVDPLAQNHARGRNTVAKQAAQPHSTPEMEPLKRLARLVEHGEGFLVSDTPEYIEGTGYRANPEFARRLHQGDFSIQAHIDLHGLTAESAKEAFETFLHAAIHSGKRAVLIIHGRGLSSPGEPVLKNKIREWLSQSYWLKRVIAYASAQSHDGGAGATYVLLRSRPVSKRPGPRRS